MLARQEDEYDRQEHGLYAGAPSPAPRAPKAPVIRKVLNTSLRSHCQVLFLVIAVLAMLVTIGSGIAASRGYKLVETQQKAEQLEQENERLNVDIAKLKNPQRIKSIAESQLNMQVPKKTYFAHESE